MRQPFFIAIMLLPLAGCTVTVVPPLKPMDPRPVFIVDYGLHASLILPLDDAQTFFVEYAYGEMEWFGRNQTQWWRVPGVLLLPNPATLARRELTGPLDLLSLRYRSGLETIFEINVAHEAINTLAKKLDARFAAGGTPLYNKSDGLFHVRDSTPYCIAHNCTTAVTDWLWELGCRCQGWPLDARFKLEQPR